MTPVENLKVVALNPFSAEYQTVDKALRRHATMMITKVCGSHYLTFVEFNSASQRLWSFLLD